MPNIKEAWKMDREHPFVKACAEGIEEVGQELKYGYWDFGTDLSVVCGKHKKAAVGYSPMQEFYCHRPIDKVRIDYMEKAIAGNASIFMKLSEAKVEDLKL